MLLHQSITCKQPDSKYRARSYLPVDDRALTSIMIRGYIGTALPFSSISIYYILSRPYIQKSGSIQGKEDARLPAFFIYSGKNRLMPVPTLFA